MLSLLLCHAVLHCADSLLISGIHVLFSHNYCRKFRYPYRIPYVILEATIFTDLMSGLLRPSPPGFGYITESNCLIDRTGRKLTSYFFLYLFVLIAYLCFIFSFFCLSNFLLLKSVYYTLIRVDCTSLDCFPV